MRFRSCCHTHYRWNVLESAISGWNSSKIFWEGGLSPCQRRSGHGSSERGRWLSIVCEWRQRRFVGLLTRSATVHVVTETTELLVAPRVPITVSTICPHTHRYCHNTGTSGVETWTVQTTRCTPLSRISAEAWSDAVIRTPAPAAETCNGSSSDSGDAILATETKIELRLQPFICRFFSLDGRANSITGQKLSISVYVNQGDTSHNRCTQRLVMH